MSHPLDSALIAASILEGVGEVVGAGAELKAVAGGGGLGRSIVLGTTENNVLGAAQQALMREEVTAGRIPITATTNAWNDTAGFGREMSQSERIYFTAEGMIDTELTQKNVTYAEIEYVLRHPDLWDKTYPVW